MKRIRKNQSKKLQRNKSLSNQIRMDQQMKSLVRLEARISMMEDKLESILTNLKKILNP